MATKDQWLAMLRDPDESERVLALEGLADEFPEEANDLVAEALQDDSPMVRAAAARLADRVEPPLTTEQLAPLLASDEEEVRLRVIRVLVERNDLEGVPPLRERLAVEEAERVLATLILGLGNLAGPEVLPDLAPFLQHDDDRVRANTVEAIDLLLQRAYRRWMIPLADDTNNRARANAALALGRFDQSAAADAIAGMVTHDDKWFRMSAAWAAGASGLPLVVNTVLPLLHDSDPEVRIQTLKSLAQHRQLPTRQALQDWLQTEDDPTVLQYAGEILGIEGVG